MSLVGACSDKAAPAAPKPAAVAASAKSPAPPAGPQAGPAPTAPTPTAPTPTAPTPTAPTAASTTPAAAKGDRRVSLFHGPMTSVKDSPAGQVDKARAEIDGSRLVRELRAQGVVVEISGSKDQKGDAVTIAYGDGTTFAFTTLETMNSDENVASLVEKVRRRFGL